MGELHPIGIYRLRVIHAVTDWSLLAQTVELNWPYMPRTFPPKELIMSVLKIMELKLLSLLSLFIAPFLLSFS